MRRHYTGQRCYVDPRSPRKTSGNLSHVRNNDPRGGNAWAAYCRAARRDAGLSQSALAKLIGVTRQTISRWEAGTYGPDRSADVVRFAESVRVDPQEALRAAGILPDGGPPPARPAKQEIPLDPDLAHLHRRLVDPQASPTEKAMIRAALRHLAGLTGADEQQRRAG